MSDVNCRSLHGKANDIRWAAGAKVAKDADNARKISGVGPGEQPTAAGSGDGGSGPRQPEVAEADAPEQVVRELERMLRDSERARWANFDPLLYRTHMRKYEDWLETEGPLAPLSPQYGMNCWEMVCYAATRAGVLDKHAQRDLLIPPRKQDGSFDDDEIDAWLVATGERLIPGERAHYTGGTDSPRPQRGDVVIWDRDMAHVALATGRTGADQSPEVFSFWPPPAHEMEPDPETGSYSRVVDAVQVTTVDFLSGAATRAGLGTDFEITFGRGPW